MEAELIAASSASDKALWFFHLLESLPFLFGNIDPSPIPLFVDNLAALSVTNHPNSGAKSRHVALREFRIRDHHEANKIRPYWCPGPLNVDGNGAPSGPNCTLFSGADRLADALWDRSGVG